MGDTVSTVLITGTGCVGINFIRAYGKTRVWNVKQLNSNPFPNDNRTQPPVGNY